MIPTIGRASRVVAALWLASCLVISGHVGEAWAAGAHQMTGATLLRHWNQIAIDASGLDHTPVQPGENRIFGQQFGPGRSSRAMAIVHIAMFDAINAVSGDCRTYTVIHPDPSASMDSAIVQAAHDTLSALFTSQAPHFDTLLAGDLASIPAGSGNAKAKGIVLGRAAANAILGMRANDGSQVAEPNWGVDFFLSPGPGIWQQDPISLLTVALGAYWADVQPFVLSSSSQYRVPEPPALDSAEYTAAYNEAKNIGGDGIITPTSRTPEQTQIGTFWAYDGTPSLCAPPRLYNQLAVHIADQMGTSSDVGKFARLLVLVNTSMADAGFSVWESKYHYDMWRPVTGIRNDDGNPSTLADPTWSPLGAPASNGNGPNFTPPFPSYPSGHGGFGGAFFETLRNFYGTDHIAFSFMSDEFNGVTVDNQGNVRPKVTRSFSSLSQAEEENGQSRIYLGIHWNFDKTEGIAQGRKVADWVFTHAFKPKH